jgi:Tfp pilus assembly protein PilF
MDRVCVSVLVSACNPNHSPWWTGLDERGSVVVLSRGLKAFFVPALLVLALYAPTLRFGLTYDDHHHVANGHPRRTLTQVWSLPFLVTEGRPGGLYRPIVTSTFWLEDTLGVPLGVRHGVNLALQVAVTLLVVRLSLLLGATPLAATVAGTLFALHPVHVEAVAGLVGRSELLAALVLLIALCDHVRARSAPPVAWPWRAALLAFLAAGSKEHAWLLPLLAVLVDLATSPGSGLQWRRYLAYGAGIGAHLLLRRVALGGWLDHPDALIAPIDNPLVLLHGVARLAAGLGVVALNIGQLIWPTGLSPDYSGPQLRLHESLAHPLPWVGAAVLVSLAGVVLRGVRDAQVHQQAVVTVGAGILLSSALAFMNLWIPLGTIFADRVLYWPSVGAALVIAGLVDATRRLGQVGHASVVVAMIALGLGYSWHSIAYLPAWRNDETLFTRAVVTAPRSPRAWLNLAKVHEANGHVDDAVAAAQRARTLDDAYQEAWSNEGSYLLRLGRWAEGEDVLRRAAQLDPADSRTRSNLGVALLQQGESSAAAQEFREALRDDPPRPETLLGLGEAEAQQGRVDAAVDAWRRYLAVVGSDPEVERRIEQALAGR